MIHTAGAARSCLGCGCATVVAIVVFAALAAVFSGGDASEPALNIDIDAALDQIVEDWQLNFGQTSWGQHVEAFELVVNGNTVSLTAKTSLYPKPENEKVARSICTGAVQVALDVTQAPRARTVVEGRGERLLLECTWEKGYPIEWYIYPALKAK